jgi:hypothetical protein
MHKFVKRAILSVTKCYKNDGVKWYLSVKDSPFLLFLLKQQQDVM